jgi:peptidase E
MDNQQPVYLFAGGRGKTIFSSFSEVGKVIKSIGKKKPDIALVGVASLKDNWLISIIMAALIKSGCKCRVHRVLIARPNADVEKAKEVLRKADAVFMGGGDAEVGMQILKEKNMVGFFRELAAQGKLFIGVSAGTILMCKGWVRWRDPDDDATAELYPCLGLVPLICDTHAEGDDWVELKAALQLEGEGATGYGIPSGGYLKAYPDGRLEAGVCTVERCAKINGKIETQAGIVPDSKTG